MTDLELAEEIERQLRNDASLDPSIMLGEEKWCAIIAALRRGPEHQPSSEMVMVPRDTLRRIQNECRDVISFQVAIHNLLSAAEAEGRKG